MSNEGKRQDEKSLDTGDSASRSNGGGGGNCNFGATSGILNPVSARLLEEAPSGVYFSANDRASGYGVASEEKSASTSQRIKKKNRKEMSEQDNERKRTREVLSLCLSFLIETLPFF